MYKIYINNAPLVLLQKGELSDLRDTGPLDVTGVYLGKSKFFFPYIDFLEKNGEDGSVTLICEDVVRAFSDFSGLFEVIEAGGGVVRNPLGKVAMIFRRGFWDLPKGKLDPGENMLQAAIREVKEELGLVHVQAGPHLITTYHTYRSGKGKRILKVSTWFVMDCRDEALIPQAEEDIEYAEWVAMGQPLKQKHPIFKNIQEVLTAYEQYLVALHTR